jgi:hypothetical protein
LNPLGKDVVGRVLVMTKYGLIGGYSCFASVCYFILTEAALVIICQDICDVVSQNT